MITPKLRSWTALLIFSSISILSIMSLLNVLFGALPLLLCAIIGVTNGVLFTAFYPTKPKKEPIIMDSILGTWHG